MPAVSDSNMEGRVKKPVQNNKDRKFKKFGVPKRAWCRARMAKDPCEAFSSACYEGTQITGFRYTRLLNPVIQRMSALGH